MQEHIITQHERRETYLDYLRGFMFILLAFDHASHAYAKLWGKYHFITMDISDRSYLFDYVYLSTNNIIMPMLFFLFGVWVVPNIHKKGVKEYIKDRMLRYIAVFILFIPTILPLMTYPRYIINNPQNHFGVWDYYFNFFFKNHLQAGPMWVMYGLFLFSMIVMAVYKLIPNCFKPMDILYRYCIRKPIHVLILMTIIMAGVFSISEALWGPYYWVGFLKLFYLQGSKFIVQFMFFWLGAYMGSKDILFNKDIMDKVSAKLIYYVILMIMFGVIYLYFATTYPEKAYSYKLLIYMKGITNPQIANHNFYDILMEILPGIAFRTLLQSFYLAFEFLTLISIFYRLFFNKKSQFWTKVAINSYGIFIFHDVISIWMQYAYYRISISPILEVITIFIASVSMAWVITHFARKVYIINRMIR